MPEKAQALPLKQPTDQENTVRIGKVYARGEVKENGETHWAFNMEINGEAKGFAFGNRKDAIKGRVLMRKKYQEDGFKLLS
jgi:hypothetical protein